MKRREAIAIRSRQVNGLLVDPALAEAALFAIKNDLFDYDPTEEPIAFPKAGKSKEKKPRTETQDWESQADAAYEKALLEPSSVANPAESSVPEEEHPFEVPSFVRQGFEFAPASKKPQQGGPRPIEDKTKDKRCKEYIGPAYYSQFQKDSINAALFARLQAALARVQVGELSRHPPERLTYKEIDL
jgi:hypothetical protein